MTVGGTLELLWRAARLPRYPRWLLTIGRSGYLMDISTGALSFLLEWDGMGKINHSFANGGMAWGKDISVIWFCVLPKTVPWPW